MKTNQLPYRTSSPPSDQPLIDQIKDAKKKADIEKAQKELEKQQSIKREAERLIDEAISILPESIKNSDYTSTGTFYLRRKKKWYNLFENPIIETGRNEYLHVEIKNMVTKD